MGRLRDNGQRQFSAHIAIPCKLDELKDQRTQCFCVKAGLRGVSTYEYYPARVSEVARNNAIADFLTLPEHARKTHLFLLDNDSAPENDFAIEKLMSHKKSFVCGITPIFKIVNEICHVDMWSAIPLSMKEFRLSDELPKGLFQAARVGGTGILVERKLLEKLDKPYQKTVWNDDITDYTMSEDFYFTEQIRKKGFDIWVDPTVIFHHYHHIDLLEFYKWIQARIEGLKKAS